MRDIHKCSELVRGAVRTGGRIQRNAIVTPVAISCEIRDRHQLDRCNPQCPQMAKSRDDRIERSFLSKCTDVQFINYEVRKSRSFPLLVGPREASGIDDLRRPMEPSWLKARSRIRQQLAVDPILIKGARGGLKIKEACVSRRLPFQRSFSDKILSRIQDHDGQIFLSRCPCSKRNPMCRDFCAL